MNFFIHFHKDQARTHPEVNFSSFGEAVLPWKRNKQSKFSMLGKMRPFNSLICPTLEKFLCVSLPEKLEEKNELNCLWVKEALQKPQNSSKLCM